MDKMNSKKYYLIYTLLFIAVLPIVFYTFFSGRKSLIWNSDGIRQHYIALMYYGKWGREIIKNIFIRGQFEFPLWDFHIGYGSDIITTMHYYVLGDPLNLSSFFVPEKYTEYLYQALIIIRFYLAGISFSFYCRQMKKRGIAVLAASFNYTFCGYMLFAGVRHPFFINPMIYLPMILAGAERIFRREKATLFVGMVFLSAISNFYFFYMIAFAVCFYVTVRFFTFSHTHIGKDIFYTICQFTRYTITGICMSAVVLIPVLIQFFSTKRTETSQYYPAFYETAYYTKLLFSFIKAEKFGEWTVLGFTVPALICIFLLFSLKKKYFSLKISFFIMTIMLCFPFFGKALNGFSYVSNRWCFIYAAFISYIMAVVWDEVIKALKQNKLIQIASISFLSLTSLHICANAFYLYGEKGKNYAQEFIHFGTAYEYIQTSPPKALKYFAEKETPFFRYETDDFKNINASSVIGEHGISYYWSLENGVIPEYYMDMSIKSFNIFNYRDLNQRTFLDALAGVKYFVRTKTTNIPFGYKYICTISLSERKKYEIYKNKYALPLGYTYDSYIPVEKYNKMDSAARQEALLSGIVIDSRSNSFPKDQFSEANINLSSKNIDYNAVYGKKIIVQADKSLKTTKKQARITLTFEGLKNCETYLFLENFNVHTKQPFHNNLLIDVCSNDAKNKIRHMTPTHKYYKGQKNYLVNLGYHDNAQTKITITLPKKGIYQFGKIKILCQPMEAYIRQIQELKKNILRNEKLGTNKIEGTINLTENKILCLSVPYSRGWHARVDQKKAKLYRANGMFMGLTLNKGEHKIQLIYRTPGLTAGIWLSILGWIMFFKMHRKN